MGGGSLTNEVVPTSSTPLSSSVNGGGVVSLYGGYDGSAEGMLKSSSV